MALLSADRDHVVVRRGLILGTVLSALLAGYGLLVYPANLNDGLASLTYGLLLGLLLAGYGAISLRMTQTRTAISAVALRHGAIWGLLFGALWLVEVLAGNLGFELSAGTCDCNVKITQPHQSRALTYSYPLFYRRIGDPQSFVATLAL
jgi:hypothetical protein